MDQQINTEISMNINNFLNTLAEEVEKALIILSNEAMEKITA